MSPAVCHKKFLQQDWNCNCLFNHETGEVQQLFSYLHLRPLISGTLNTKISSVMNTLHRLQRVRHCKVKRWGGEMDSFNLTPDHTRCCEGRQILSTWHLTTHTAVKHDNIKACGYVLGTQCVSNCQLIYKWSSNILTIITSITHEPIWYWKTGFWEFCMLRLGGSFNHHIATPMSHWRPNHRAGLAITSHNGRSP